MRATSEMAEGLLDVIISKAGSMFLKNAAVVSPMHPYNTFDFSALFWIKPSIPLGLKKSTASYWPSISGITMDRVV